MSVIFLLLIHIVYLYHQLSTLREQFESSATHGGVFTNLTTAGIKEFSFLIPSFDEQKAIAQILSEMGAEIETLEKKRDKYKAVKQVMMQELLTGKTRLNYEL
ncbi:MAG: restriction endonuclease subunit S [Pyrinomonadaceae bacterium]